IDLSDAGMTELANLAIADLMRGVQEAQESAYRRFEKLKAAGGNPPSPPRVLLIVEEVGSPRWRRRGRIEASTLGCTCPRCAAVLHGGDAVAALKHDGAGRLRRPLQFSTVATPWPH